MQQKQCPALSNWLCHFIFIDVVDSLFGAARLYAGIYNRDQYPERAEAIQ